MDKSEARVTESGTTAVSQGHERAGIGFDISYGVSFPAHHSHQWGSGISQLELSWRDNKTAR